MQVPILNGVYTDAAGDFRSSYPRNLIPVPKDQGISKGYLRPADGVVQTALADDVCRGGINWNGKLYRVQGTFLCSVASDGTVTKIGEIGGAGPVTMDYSFDRLAIESSGLLWYYLPGVDTSTGESNLRYVSDADIGQVNCVQWVDGYFMTTDGTVLVVTDLNDPFSVNPLKYGSSEIDPDPVVRLLKLNDEPYAVNRYTVEAFRNVGGDNFPFQRVDGAQLPRGAVGKMACAVFADNLAFLGSGRNEPPSVWLGNNGDTAKLATREIDTILQGYTEAQLATAVCEVRVDKSHVMLYVHLPDQTLVYDHAASEVSGERVWFTLDSAMFGEKTAYTARYLTWCYDAWQVGDHTSGRLGRLSFDTSDLWGQPVGWEASTVVIYNESAGAIVHELELVCLSGRAPLGEDGVVWTEYSVDGMEWSQPELCRAGRPGERRIRIAWLEQGSLEQWRVQRFRGSSRARLSLARLEATLEALHW